jgi:cyclomaltodextrinase / maltogenic alpha-amylase / neopullulanase
VKKHLFQAIEMWIRDFDIDGLRLDAADVIDVRFLSELSGMCRSIRPDFWLVGEVVHGDYRKWANPQTLDSVTNYEIYKGLYSSHADKNYFEIAYALERQFGERGLYRSLQLYNFADNHDVDRVASKLKNPAQLYPLYCLLFTIPGVPSIYYGSEWGIEGRKQRGSDRALRPALELASLAQKNPQPDLVKAIAGFARIRLTTASLTYGDYRQLYVSSEQFAFARCTQDECVLVVVNDNGKTSEIELAGPNGFGDKWEDLLNSGEIFKAGGGKLKVNTPPFWARILKARM